MQVGVGTARTARMRTRMRIGSQYLIHQSIFSQPQPPQPPQSLQSPCEQQGTRPHAHLRARQVEDL